MAGSLVNRRVPSVQPLADVHGRLNLPSLTDQLLTFTARRETQARQYVWGLDDRPTNVVRKHIGTIRDRKLFPMKRER